MSNENKSLAKYWLMFLVSLAICIGFLILLPEWFWVTLPFVFTYFVLAMDWIDPDVAE